MDQTPDIGKAQYQVSGLKQSRQQARGMAGRMAVVCRTNASLKALF
jgi:hypothetical protein